MKRIDLSNRAGMPIPASPIPSFTPENHDPGAQTTTAASQTIDIFPQRGALTVRYIILQLSLPTTIQLMLNGQDPLSPVLTLPANAIIKIPGLLLPNNCKLSMLVGSACTLTYDVVWIKDFSPGLICKDYSITLGTEVLRKKTFIETTTPLGLNGVFTGPWHDSELDGTLYVIATAYCGNVGSATNGFVLEETEDTSNANLTRSISLGNVNAATLTRKGGRISARFWRVRYTAAAAQTSFELTAAAYSFPTFPTTVGVINTQEESYQAVQLVVTSVGNDDNTANSNSPNDLGGTSRSLSVSNRAYGGSFGGTADATRSGWTRARTPTIYRTVATAALGSTAIWTPGTGNKFRLLKYRIQLSANASIAVAGLLVITFLDAAGVTNLTQEYFVPAAAAALNNYDQSFIDLGSFGYLSTAANAILNVNLSVALATGSCRVLVMGTEE